MEGAVGEEVCLVNLVLAVRESGNVRNQFLCQLRRYDDELGLDVRLIELRRWLAVAL